MPLRFRVVNIESMDSRMIASVPPIGPWKIGLPGSGALIEIDEPALDKVELNVVAASYHLILKGVIPEGAVLPPLGLCRSAEIGQWNWGNPLDWPSALENGKLHVRFDYGWLKIGKYALKASSKD